MSYLLNISVANDKRTVVFVREDGHQQRFSGKWLRQVCVCDYCKSSNAFRHRVNTVPASNITVENLVIKDEELHCAVNVLRDKHETAVPLDLISGNCNCDACIETSLLSCKVKPRSTEQCTPYIEYKNTLTDEGLLRCLGLIIDHGFCVVRNFPTDEKSCVQFGTSIGFTRSTTYGENFRVRSEARPSNAAYTSLKLPSHQDIVFYESSPGVQYLLAVRFDKEVEGGETKIVDMIRCAEILREEFPKHFDTFCRVPVSFLTIDMVRPSPCWYKNTKPHIELDCFGEIVAVNWHPALEATLRIREKDVEAYYEAHKTFMNIVNDPKNRFMFRLQTGDYLIVNNHRVSHSREAFTSVRDGDRHLFGYFIEMDDVKSKYMTLSEKLEMKILPTKIGGRSSF